MDSLEPKKLALLRIWQIFKDYSDYDHLLTQEDIAQYLEKDYGIVIERKAIGRNISLLKEAGVEIESPRRAGGSYLVCRDFEDSELKLLIDSVLCSQHINTNQSTELIDKLCGLSNKYFRSHVKNIHTVKEWNKTENAALFYNIETVDKAITEGKQLQYDYNKYGIDKKLHKSSFQRITPYQLILHNQRYYLMGYSDYWGNMVYHRLDRISNIDLYDKAAKSIRDVAGFESGIDFKRIATAMPYMYHDEPERIEFLATDGIVDQVVDWFGKDITITPTDKDHEVCVSLWASPSAMEHWAMQYINHVEIVSPSHLRDTILQSLRNGAAKYSQ